MTSIFTPKIWVTILISIPLSALCLTSCDNTAPYFLLPTFTKGMVLGGIHNKMALSLQMK